jgi:hypothetical protein
MYFKQNKISKLYYFASTIGIFFIYWRNYCSIRQIDVYYNNSKIKHVLGLISNRRNHYQSNLKECIIKEKFNRSLLYDMLLNIIPLKKIRNIMEELLQFQFCLTNDSFLENVVFEDLISSRKIEQLQIMPVTMIYELNIPDKEKYLQLTSLILKNNNRNYLTNNIFENKNYQEENKTLKSKFFSIIYELSEHSDILKSFKKGFYVMNVMDTVKLEFISRIDKIIFVIKDNQNKVEFFIKQILMEISYLFGIVMNYTYFVLWAITFIGIWILRFTIPMLNPIAFKSSPVLR